MANVQMPIVDTALRISPPLGPHVPIEDRLQQVLALLLGYSRGERIPLVSSPSGVLFTASPCLADVFHWTAAAPNTTKQGDNIACSRVFLRNHPDNVGRIWVRNRIAATSGNAVPIDPKEPLWFTIDNLSDLHVLIENAGDTLIVAYCL